MSATVTDSEVANIGYTVKTLNVGTPFWWDDKGEFYPVIIRTLGKSRLVSAKIVSTIQVVPKMRDDVRCVLSMINLHSSRFNWRLFEEGHYAVEAERFYEGIDDFVIGFGKFLGGMRRKFATYFPSIEDVAFERKKLLDIIGRLETVR